MRQFLFLGVILITNTAIAEDLPTQLAPIPEPPELPMPVQDGEPLEPDITIRREGEKTIQEFRKNGQIYMIKVIPIAGPAYYFIDTDGDGNMDVRKSDLDNGTQINQWKLFQWD